MNRIICSFVIVLFLVVIAGCQTNNETKTNSKEDKNDIQEVNKETKSQDSEDDEKNIQEEVKIDVPELPQTIKEIADYPVGIYASSETDIVFKDKDAKETVNKIVSNNGSGIDVDVVLPYLYSLFKMGYNDPQQIIDSIKISNNSNASDVPAELKVETFNVEIILDSSGSMANKMGAKTRMELAKEAIKEFTASLPEQANVGLRVYGHKGTGSDQDKKMSCSANELVYQIKPYNESGINNALNKFNPAGWTPLANSIKKAQDDLSNYKGKENKNIIYLVSDGIETCGGDPVAEAKNLKNSDVKPVVNIIGFDVKGEDQQQLKNIAEAADGTYSNVQNQQQLHNEFQKSIEEASKWQMWFAKGKSSSYEQYGKIKTKYIKFFYKWKENMRYEKYNIENAIHSLKYEEKITSEQETILLQKMNDYYEKLDSLVEEMGNTLQNSNDKNLDDTLEKLETSYNQNVS